MKFAVQVLATRASRLGAISDIERLPGVIFETPLLLLYTKGGTVPHITYEVLQMITKEPQAIQIPLPSVIHSHDSVAAFKKGIAEFVGLKEHLIYCSVQDPAMATPQGYNDKDLVAIWGRNGKQLVDSEKYMEVMEAFLPDIYQPLCDGDTNVNSSKRRVSKSLNRSRQLFEKCIAKHKNLECLKHSSILGVIEGGYDLSARAHTAKALATEDVAGFVIDGLHNNGPDVEILPYDRIKPVVNETVKKLPAGKFRIVHGCFDPSTILNLIEDGIDIFDSSYPYLVTERGSALTFKFKEHDLGVPHIPELASVREQTSSENDVVELLRFSGQVTRDDKTSTVRSGIVDVRYEISLKDEIYKDDLGALSDTCTCYTCRKFARAYIHHLLKTKELLAHVLLAIHNFHHYLEFFKSIRRELKEGSLDNIRKLMELKTEHAFKNH